MLHRLRPTQNEIVEACATAARLLRHDRDDIPVTLLHQRARQIAIAALREVFPHLQVRDAGRLLGLEGAEFDNVEMRFANARRTSWWEDQIVQECAGVLAGYQLGARAS